MSKPTLSITWLLSVALCGVVVLALLLLTLTAVQPGSAANQSLWPEAISNPQKAAILGAQNLLVDQQIPQSIYLPAVIR